MASDSKPGFFDGLIEALAQEPETPEDSDELHLVKQYIDDIGLDIEDKVKLAGWLFGDSLKSSIISMLSDL